MSLSDAAKALIAAENQNERSTPADQARIAARLQASVAAGVPPPELPPLPQAVAGGLTKGLIITTISVVAGATVLGAALWRASADGAQPLPAVPIQAAPPVEPDQIDEPAPTAPQADVPSPVPQLSTPPKRHIDRTRNVDVTPRAQPTPKPVPPSAPITPLAPPIPTPPVDSLVAETAGLREVHAALRAGELAKALQLLGEQDVAFSGGALQPERDAARVIAICREDSGKGSSALEAFDRKYPRSHLRQRLERECMH